MSWCFARGIGFLLLHFATPPMLPSQVQSPTRATALSQGPRRAPSFESASLFWDAGRYPEALRELQNILGSADAEKEREAIALLTGENWQTLFIAENGRAPRWSPHGKFIAYELGMGANRTTRVVNASTLTEVVAEVAGASLVFSPDESRIAWIAGAVPGGALMVRDLASGRDRIVPDQGLLKSQLLFNDAGNALFVTAAVSGSTRTDIWSIPLADGAIKVLTNGDTVRADLQLNARNNQLLYNVGGRSPLAAGGRGGGGGGGGGGAGVRNASTRFAVFDIASSTERVFTGESPVVSADGSTAAFITRTGGRNNVYMLSLKPLGTPQLVHATSDSLAALALSPTGVRVVFQQQPTYDWDLYAVTRDSAAAPVRLTRDIQHDLQPRFLDNDHLVALIGEARHRRSYVYDLVNGSRKRLFHNNTIRTIAPEYEWIASPDATRMLIVAERDGDTVTPHRHLWMVDLAHTVSVAELKTRVGDQLRQELALRARGVGLFAPIAAAVHKAVSEVSTDRVYRHEKTLFDFDSKHVTRPGNLKARTYLLGQYQSFGLETRFQPFEARIANTQTTVPTANVLATLKGTENPELVYVVSSHFDSRAEGPGADDNTSGTAALLEAARVLSTRPQPATIVFASFTGEEAGLLGSREFVRQAKADGLRFVGALNNDMLGWSNDNRLDNTIRYSNAGIRDVQHAAAMQFSRMITYDAFYYKSTDAAAFYDGYGDIVGGIGSYPVLGNPHYHQPHDVLEVENHELIAEASKTTIATLMLLASSPSRISGLAAERVARGYAVKWTPSPEKGIVRYLVRYGPVSAPERWTLTTTRPAAMLPNAQAGMLVQVKAVNSRGMEGWDWARLTIADK